MTVVILTDIDVAGQLSLLWRGLNAFTPFKARYICLKQTYLDYQTDIVPQKGMEAEIAEIITQADFFIFGRALIDFPFYSIASRLNRNNHLVIVYGSEARTQPEHYCYMWLRKDLMTVSNYDYSCAANLGFSAQHIPPMYNPDEIPPKQAPNDGIVRIAHTPTNRAVKQTDVFLKACEELRSEGLPVQPLLIEGKPWKECLQIKRQAEIMYDQMAIGCYGFGAIESWAMEQAVLGRLNHWVRSFWPQAPVLDVTPETLKATIKQLVEDPNLLKLAQKDGKAHARKHHEWRKVIPRWEHLIRWVHER